MTVWLTVVLGNCFTYSKEKLKPKEELVKHEVAERETADFFYFQYISQEMLERYSLLESNPSRQLFLRAIF